MTIRDRTTEFHACAESLSQRNNVASSALLGQHSQHAKSEFTKAASQIAREINSTMAKLHSLTQLAKKKTLFDDRPTEINDLTLAIKADITKINRQIALLQQHQRSQQPQQPAAKQIQEHSTNVITSLQTKLASTSSEFKSILELRTQNMKDQKSRRDQYTAPPTASASSSAAGYSLQGQQPTPQQSPFSIPQPQQPMFGLPPSTSSPLFSDGLRNRSTAGSSDSAVIDMGGMGGGSQQQLLMQSNNTATLEYIESRGQAIESIESTIAELGQIYSQFTQILSQQREMVQRIDVNVMDTEMNVVSAHNELAKFLERLQGNRWLMIQVFGILVVFFMLFVIIS
ncbi:t-SNARE [Rhizoclosmatium globosum]|uniref:t-SNARE n=1 Tax=Rhizoclosmatium globosum TaxID=329046 RepID=A0A1Y2D393_9FUNG|nr:t-SNARE [Rhizoclosmatium globosum]|eukprot:ORY53759.1 t-SNARE [Rhizoclosmatium globosum]